MHTTELTLRVTRILAVAAVTMTLTLSGTLKAAREQSPEAAVASQMSSPKLLAKRAAWSIQVGSPADAIPFLERCLALKPKDKKCNDLLNDAHGALERMLLQRLNSADPRALRVREKLLADLHRIAPAKYARELSALRSRIQILEAQTNLAIQKLHDGDAAAATDLLHREDNVDVVASLHSEWVKHQSLDRARASSGRGEYDVALGILRTAVKLRLKPTSKSPTPSP